MRYGLILVAVLAAVCVADDPCQPTVTFSDGSVYVFNLTGLSHPAGVPDTIQAYDDTYNTYYINICGQTTTAGDKECKGAAVCQMSAVGDYNNAGQLSSQAVFASNDTEPGQGLIVKYSDGTRCNNGDPRQTTITLVCDPSVDPLVDMVKEVSHCSYSVYIRSKYACGESVSGGGDTVALVILLILVCGFVLYFVVGAVYQKKVKDAANLREMIIHNEFWCSLPYLVKDGVLFIGHGCKKGDYISV